RELRREAQEIPGGFFKIGANDPVARTNPDLIGVNVPGLLGSTLFEQTRERKGGLVSLQFKPSDSLTLGLNGFSSELQANNYNRNFMMFGNSFAKSQA
ncbi:TonB-dependent receptor, partial [Mesorhizobium sp. M2D.F.Ca.ET.160.01.1.1]